METPTPRPSAPAAIPTNLYAKLAPINGGLAFLSNCLSLFSVIFAPLTYICAAISGLLSLGALLTGFFGLVQVNRSRGSQKGKGLAVTGMVLGILGLIAAILIPLLLTTLLVALGVKIGDLLLVPVE